MSVKAMAAVWDMDLPRDQKFVLLAYADHADHDGGSIYPAVELVARKTGYSERSIQTITRELAAAGRLVADGKGPRGTRRWRMPLVVAGEVSAPPQIEAEEAQPAAPRGAVAAAPEPSVTVNQPSREERADAIPKPHPAVAIFREETGLYPKRSLKPDIEDAVGSSEESLELWRRVIHGWIARGYSKVNVEGPLQWFKAGGVPERGNGKAREPKGFQAIRDYDRLVAEKT